MLSNFLVTISPETIPLRMVQPAWGWGERMPRLRALVAMEARRVRIGRGVARGSTRGRGPGAGTTEFDVSFIKHVPLSRSCQSLVRGTLGLDKVKTIFIINVTPFFLPFSRLFPHTYREVFQRMHEVDDLTLAAAKGACAYSVSNISSRQ